MSRQSYFIDRFSGSCMLKMTTSILTIFLSSILLVSCDPQRKNECEWYIVPFPEGNTAVKVGWVSLCVANFKLGRQRCFFTAKPGFVDRLNGVPFQYSSMRYTETLPKKIISVESCKKK